MKKIFILALFLGHSLSYPLFQGFRTFGRTYSKTSGSPFNRTFTSEHKHNNTYRTAAALGLGIFGTGFGAGLAGASYQYVHRQGEFKDLQTGEVIGYESGHRIGYDTKAYLEEARREREAEVLDRPSVALGVIFGIAITKFFS